MEKHVEGPYKPDLICTYQEFQNYSINVN